MNFAGKISPITIIYRYYGYYYASQTMVGEGTSS